MPPPQSPPPPPPSTPTRAQLQQSLERVHAELASSAQVDAHSRALLQAVLADIRRLLAAPEGRSAEATVENAPRRLADLTIQFEAHHPVLAGSVRQFVDLLGRAGL